MTCWGIFKSQNARRSVLSNKRSWWILQFDEPLPPVFRKLQSVILENAVVPVKSRSNRVIGSKATTKVEGTIDEIMMTLKRILKEDYKRNRRETTGASWHFDYVVENESGQINVFTRLYGSNDEGSIYYGRTIRRVSSGRFVMWVDD